MTWKAITTDSHRTPILPVEGPVLVAIRGYTKDDGSWTWNYQIGARLPHGALQVPRDTGYPAFWQEIEPPKL